MLAMLAGAGGCSTDMGEVKSTATVAPESTAPAAMNPAEANLVKLEQALHFAGPGGEDVLVPAGQYQVQTGEGSQLKLVSKEQPQPVLLAAIALSHDENIDVPMARVVAGEEETQRVFLLTPGGTGLAALGSESGVGGRGIASMLGGIKTLNAPAPIQQLYTPQGGWVKAKNGVLRCAAGWEERFRRRVCLSRNPPAVAEESLCGGYFFSKRCVFHGARQSRKL